MWRRTPRQVERAFRGQEKMYQRAHNERAWLAWHIAALSRVEARHFPKLDKLMVGERGRRGREKQTPAQMLAIARTWTQRLGGTVKDKRGN